MSDLHQVSETAFANKPTSLALPVIHPAQEAALALVLDGLPSEHSRRAYTRALRDFFAWHESVGRPPLNKALAQKYVVHLRTRGLAAPSINQHLAALRKLVTEGADNGLLAQEVAESVRRVKGARQEGRRTGHWLLREEAQAWLSAPDTRTLKGLRDRALLALLLGCGLRRAEAAALSFIYIQQREGRWVIVDLVGKREKIRSVPMPSWAKAALDAWSAASGITEGLVFRAVNKGDKVQGAGITPQAIRNIVTGYATRLGPAGVAPHDLRRTFAKLAHKGGAALEQIQLSLGHQSVQTTERYLGVEQDWHDAPCDKLGLK